MSVCVGGELNEKLNMGATKASILIWCVQSTNKDNNAHSY